MKQQTKKAKKREKKTKRNNIEKQFDTTGQLN